MSRAQTASLTKRLTLPPMWAIARRRGAAASTSASSAATSQLVMQASAGGQQGQQGGFVSRLLAGVVDHVGEGVQGLPGRVVEHAGVVGLADGDGDGWFGHFQVLTQSSSRKDAETQR